MATVMRKLRLELDGYHGSAMQAIEQSGYIDAKVLAANTAETVTVPTGARIVLFSATDNFYMDTRTIPAVIPTADISNGTAPEFNPIARMVTAADTFSLIAPTACIVIMSWYK